MIKIVAILLLDIFLCESLDNTSIHILTERTKPVADWNHYSYYKNKYPEAVVKPYLNKIIRIVDKPNGTNTIAFIKSNIYNGDAYNVFLLKKNNNFFKVAVFNYHNDDVIAIGWIKKDYIGIYVRNYASPLYLYDNSNQSSLIIAQIHDYYPDLADIEDFDKLWMKIKFYYKGNLFLGWIPFEMQCPNVLTTCS